MDYRRQARAAMLRSLGADALQIEECLQYTENVFEAHDATFPLADEPFVATWEKYAEQNRETGSIEFLREYLVQLRFPIASGISVLPGYREVTRKGRPAADVPEATGLKLRAPECCRIQIHSTPQGRIPLLIASVREDFVALVRALSKRNEPVEVPDSMGACMLAGYNNWHRIQMLTKAAGPDWMSQRDQYQDRLIILSEGPYSGISASDLGLDDADWRRISLVIRREHECAHYFTRRVFSSMRNHLLDELIADYCGIFAALGHFRADWFLRFAGLENFPHYREGGRLQNYRGDPPLSSAAFAILQGVVKLAAETLQHLNRPPDARWMATISQLTLEEVAMGDGLTEANA
jgi:hypothetical protein